MKRKSNSIVVAALGLIMLVAACNFGGGGGDEVPTGQPTAKWFVEKGPPSNSQGANGDLYLDTDAAVLYVKTNGQWVAAASLRGPAGSGWLFGSGGPASTLGSDGDLYLDTSTSMTYRKQGGVWSTLFALKGDTGAPGAPGTQWFSGTASPTPTVPATARTGDYYFQTSTAMIYRKDAGGNWSSVLSVSCIPSFIFTPNMQNFNYNLPFNAVTCGKGTYVAVGNDGLIARSEDGTNWEVVSCGYEDFNPSLIRKGLKPYSYVTNITSDFYDVAYGNNIFVAVGEAVYTSTDGKVWQQRSITGGQPYNHVVFLNEKFFISSSTNTIFVSSDGVEWNSCNSQGWGLSAVAYGNNKYIAISQPEGIARVCTSTDGITWSFFNEINGLNGYVSGLVFGSGLFVAVGSMNDTGTIWWSNDGINWTTQDIPVGSVYFQDIAYGNGFAAVGSNCILTSTNGISWNIHTFPYMDGVFSGVCPGSAIGTFMVSH